MRPSAEFVEGTEISDITGPHQSLNPTGIVGDTFAVMLANPVPLLTISAIPALAEAAITIWIDSAQEVAEGSVTSTEIGDIFLSTIDFSMSAYLFAFAVVLVVWSISLSATIHAVLEIKSDQQVHILAAFSTGLRFVLPVAVFSLLTGLAVLFWSIILILPGLYLIARWFVVVPAITVDRAGIHAIQRSADLTEGYRWPMVGLASLYFIIVFVFAIIVGITEEILHAVGVSIVVPAFVAVTSAMSYAFSGTLTALAYLRLYEIKESGGSARLEDIFD